MPFARNLVLVWSCSLVLFLLSCAQPPQRTYTKVRIDFDALAAAELGKPGAGAPATSEFGISRQATFADTLKSPTLHSREGDAQRNAAEIKQQREEIQQLKRNVTRQLN